MKKHGNKAKTRPARMPLPIPLHCPRGSVIGVGTGFLVRNESNVWLTTCVHIITGLKQTPPSLEYFAGRDLQVVGATTILPLFEGVTQRFRVIKTEVDGFLADVMAIKLSDTEAAVLSSFGAHSLSSVVPPKLDEPILATGFQGMGRVVIPPTTVKGHVADIVGISVKLTIPSALGLSGSALLGAAGLIGIVHGDTGEASELTNGLAISLSMVGPQLFV